PRPEVIVALHTFPIRAGWIGVSPGLALAGMEEFRVRLYSPAGHLSMLMARVSSALRDLSTAQAPAGPATFDALVRRMRTDEALADAVLISCWPYIGDLSSTHHLMGLSSVCTAERRDRLHRQIHETLDRCTARAGASYDLDYTFANPPVYNDPALTEALWPAMEAAVGAGHVLRFRAPYPFAHEDFALYQEHIPGLFLWLGIANHEAEIDSLLHQPDFDIDEDALVVGARLMVLMLKRYLQTQEAQAAQEAQAPTAETSGA
ncbi:MAG: M20/M25/M40 family metallo-hydrolase, partial [Chloroflexi bacterium]|nr:M20/M25/M40 family metallo-hydrolase [Chloroflexota bacterium]